VKRVFAPVESVSGTYLPPSLLRSTWPKLMELGKNFLAVWIGIVISSFLGVCLRVFDDSFTGFIRLFVSGSVVIQMKSRRRRYF